MQRSGINGDMDNFKIILDSLIDSKTIIRKVLKKGESFCVNDSYDVTCQ